MDGDRNGRPGRRYDEMAPVGVTDEMLERACRAFLTVYGDPAAKWFDYGKEIRAALEAALPSGVRVKPLVWSDSMVFGTRKWRGSGPFGEFTAFSGNDLTDVRVAEKKSAAQADYERRIISALEGEGE